MFYKKCVFVKKTKSELQRKFRPLYGEKTLKQMLF